MTESERKAIKSAEREKVAQWMISNGFATGHGDNIDDLMASLMWQVDEIKKQAGSLEKELERERQVRNMAIDDRDLYAQLLSEALADLPKHHKPGHVCRVGCPEYSSGHSIDADGSCNMGCC